MPNSLARLVSPLYTAASLIRSALGRAIGSDDAPPDHDQRRALYEYLWNCYANELYNRAHFKGSLDYVNRELGEAAAQDLAGLFNPIERLVEVHVQNVFRGSFGDEIRIAPDVITNSGAIGNVNPAIVPALYQIFRWSNLNIENQKLVRYAAINGTCVIRVVARVGRDYPNDRVEDRRVYLSIEHPGVVVDALQDDRGNITQCLSEHQRREGDLSLDGDDRNLKEFTVRILVTKDEFTAARRQEGFLGSSTFSPVNAITLQAGSDAAQPNSLGVCPIVFAKHRNLGGLWGAWAFFGQMPKIDRLNALVAHINRQIWRHVNVRYLISGAGRAPKEIDFSGGSVLYHRRRTGDTSPVTIQALVSNLNLEHAIAEAKFILAELRDSIPELKAVDGDFLSGQSGETIAHLRQPAEQRILDSRTLYEDAIVRAAQMALSWGVLLGLWNRQLGILPTREAAEAAFRNGAFNFRFNNRPALPETIAERLDREERENDLADAREERRINAEAARGDEGGGDRPPLATGDGDPQLIA